MLWARNLWDCGISLFETVPATGFLQIFGSERRALEDMVETTLLEGTMDLKVVLKCNPFLTIITITSFSGRNIPMETHFIVAKGRE